MITQVSVIQALPTLTHPLEMYQGQLPWVTRRGRPWDGEHGMQVLRLRGPRKTSVNSDKHLNLLLPPFWSKFVSGMITTCKLFMPLCLLNQPVKFSYQSLLRFLLKVFIFSSLCFLCPLCLVQIVMDLSPPEIINFRGLDPDHVNLHIPSIDPTSVAGRH